MARQIRQMKTVLRNVRQSASVNTLVSNSRR